MALNYFDVIVVCVLLLFSLRGCLRGFVGEIAGIAGILGGLWLAHRYHMTVAAHLLFLNDPVWRVMAAYVLTFLAVLMSVGLLGRVLRKILAFSFVSWVDKAAGFLLGLLKGLIACALLLFVAQRFVGDAEFMRQSRTLPYINAVMEQVRARLPAPLAEKMSFLRQTAVSGAIRGVHGIIIC